jgi:fumarylacetoacetase
VSDLNETHDPARRSWLGSANEVDTDFPIQNLPFGVFKRGDEDPRGGVAIGDCVFDLKLASDAGLFTGEAAAAARAASGSALNALLQLGNRPASALRKRLSDLLREGGSPDLGSRRSEILVPLADVTLLQPVRVTGFNDFSCSVHHISRFAAPWPALQSIPVTYNGRASSVCVSGTPVVRPLGRHAFPPPNGEEVFGPEVALDFELEFGAYLTGSNPLGQPISMETAQDRLFGYSIVNDWSARGIQYYEMVLGPMLGKSFLTTVSPWVVTAEAMAPFQIPLTPRPEGSPAVPTHLDSSRNRTEGSLNVELDAYIRTPQMRASGGAPERLVHTNFKHMYWTFAQMAAHLASNGCNLQTGDLMGSGTASGPDDEERACLAEINRVGADPIHLSNGETRLWLEDGDDLILRARAVRDGYVPIGFGPCDGRIAPAPEEISPRSSAMRL